MGDAWEIYGRHIWDMACSIPGAHPESDQYLPTPPTPEMQSMASDAQSSPFAMSLGSPGIQLV